MANRLGDKFSQPPLQAVDRTRIFVAQLLLKKPHIDFEFGDDGSIRVIMPLHGSALSPDALPNARLLRTRWFANTVGEYLVRTNLEPLDDIVCRSDFPDLAGQQCHTDFGLWINPSYLQFQFHCELLNRIFNEGLRWELRGLRT